jgi:hypothetical protein
LFEENVSGVFLNEELLSLKALEERKNTILDNEENGWRLKHRANRLAEGDNNTNFFHNFVNFRKKCQYDLGS